MLIAGWLVALIAAGIAAGCYSAWRVSREQCDDLRRRNAELMDTVRAYQRCAKDDVLNDPRR